MPGLALLLGGRLLRGHRLDALHLDGLLLGSLVLGRNDRLGLVGRRRVFRRRWGAHGGRCLVVVVPVGVQ